GAGTGRTGESLLALPLRSRAADRRSLLRGIPDAFSHPARVPHAGYPCRVVFRYRIRGGRPADRDLDPASPPGVALRAPPATCALGGSAGGPGDHWRLRP